MSHVYYVAILAIVIQNIKFLCVGSLPNILKEYRMVFRAGLRDPCARDVARLSESVKILEPQASVFFRFPKVEQHPKCMDHAILLRKRFGKCFIKLNYSETMTF
jgi:hypothetical protein